MSRPDTVVIDAYYHGSRTDAHGPCCAQMDRETGRFFVLVWDSDIDLENVRPESLDFFADTPRTHDGLCRCGGEHFPVYLSVPHGLILDDEEI